MTTSARLPAIHAVVEDPRLGASVERYGREMVVNATRAVVAEERLNQRRDSPAVTTTEIIAKVEARLVARPTLFRRVINATGVVLHTNLGRTSLSAPAWEAMDQARGICDLEMSLTTGERASRFREAEKSVTAVTGAASGLIVNNNASAVLLAIAALAGRRPTAISRGHLVEIGGGFRLPTIMEASGSPLLEVGTTNRTNLADYELAIDQGAALILVVHRSNFVMTGYVAEPTAKEIVALARRRNVPVVLDLGSGALLDTRRFGLPHELMVTTAVAAGFDAVCFSGDKLVGGPQAGILAGAKTAIAAMQQHPLARAMRCDKIQLAGVVATLELYQRGEAEKQIPLWQLLAQPLEILGARAQSWQVASGIGTVVEAFGTVGGGTLPDAKIPGLALAFNLPKPEKVLADLRGQDPPIVGHIDRDRILLHPRSVLPEEDIAVQAALTRWRA